MKIVTLAATPSTNTALSAMAADGAGHGTAVRAVAQTAGRGQRGNTWEAAPGQNLTLSVLLMPRRIAAARQFELSMLVSLAIVHMLDQHIEADRVKIKWPNDIYVDDLKICGILIENSLVGPAIRHSVVGIGLNVNQRQFVSDAPNPVSLAQLTGRTYDLDDLCERLCQAVIKAVDDYDPATDAHALLYAYHTRLWRADGLPHPWREPATGQQFDAAIAAVAPDGQLTLRLPDRTTRTYAFKQIAPILTPNN